MAINSASGSGSSKQGWGEERR